MDYGVAKETEWTPDLANSLLFLGILMNEVQRLHNPSYQPGRTALTDVIIPGGHRIPAESVMIVAIHHTHNNPKVWDHPAKARILSFLSLESRLYEFPDDDLLLTLLSRYIPILFILFKRSQTDSEIQFDPDHWNLDKVKNRHKTAYVQFAAGPRM